MIPDIKSIHTIVFDFDGVFTDNCVYVDQNGNESVKCNRGDGLGINMLNSYIIQNSLDIDYFILSKEQSDVVMKRASKLKLRCEHGIDDKYSYLMKYLRNRFPNKTIKDSATGIIYLGNDINDYEAMSLVGTSVAPIDAHPSIQKISNVVLPKAGGDQFVRHFIEILIDKSD